MTFAATKQGDHVCLVLTGPAPGPSDVFETHRMARYLKERVGVPQTPLRLTLCVLDQDVGFGEALAAVERVVERAGGFPDFFYRVDLVRQLDPPQSRAPEEPEVTLVTTFHPTPKYRRPDLRVCD